MIKRRKRSFEAGDIAVFINAITKKALTAAFYSFPSRPYERERRQRWIQAVRRAGPDGGSWEPNANTRICSRHFSGNAKSNIMHHPAYVPTIFPSAYRRTVPCDPSAATERFQRWRKRVQAQAKSPSNVQAPCEGKVESSEDEEGEVLPAFAPKCEEPATKCSTTSAEHAVEPNAKCQLSSRSPSWPPLPWQYLLEGKRHTEKFASLFAVTSLYS
uniref:Isl2eu-5 hm n=1 Tax=Rhipicephalus zambeziensis TaxID=60191 RepID=A0A224YRU7_9ACAR